MPSQALLAWKSSRSDALDEIETAHQSIGGTGPGRRYTTQQINHAYAMLLSSQFQGFCRELHSESVDCLTAIIGSAAYRTILRNEFRFGRKLDKGNPNAGNIGSDFARMGLRFWDAVEARDTRAVSRREQLEELNVWRNAIAHQDFDANVLGSAALRLAKVREWRSACDGLAVAFDEVMYAYLGMLMGAAPW